MADSQLLAILLVAMVAGIILFRLYTVLGRRTGHEHEPRDGLRRIGGGTAAKGDNVVALPERSADEAKQDGAAAESAAAGLVDIKLADRHFETERFLDGARQAYETIVKAFAARDRDTLRPLLNDEVFGAFDGVMREREARHETVSYTFVGFRNVRVVHAALKADAAEITVEFGAQYVSATTDADGKLIEGDSKAVRDVTDVWTFARDIRATDPNWTLVATAGAD